MALTEFGKAVRKARIDTGETLVSMANTLETTASYLSALETGRKNVSPQWVEKIEGFFAAKGRQVENLASLAAVSNKTIPIDGLSLQQQMLVAGFAQSKFSADELKTIATLIDKINNGKKENDGRSE